MQSDGRYIEHTSEFDKVLGYRYHSDMDSIQLSEISLDYNACTKRSILSQSSSVFDPLSLCLPVSIRCKTLLRELWLMKLSWDDTVPEQLQHRWNFLAKDLNLLSSLKFPRCTIHENQPASMFIFCDASKVAYGFVMYAVQGNTSHLIFSKAKVAPIKSKSLPTLELLGVFLAIKCLNNVFGVFNHIEFNKLYIVVDAQIVLSWLLNKTVNTKNQFAKNRIKDINLMLDELQFKFTTSIHFKYVSSTENPADILTRGLSFDKFQSIFDFWIHGPTWIRSESVTFPVSNLDCLNSYNKSLVNYTYSPDNALISTEPFIAFDRFSCLSQLINSTSLVFKFIYLLKKRKIDHRSHAQTYLLKLMQAQCFPAEIKFLKDSKMNKPTDLVNNLNLFLDSDGLIRCGGRLGQSHLYDFEVIHPILLGKKHDLTKLIIDDCHRKCQHLGLATTLNRVRLSGYWVPKARQAVKSVLSQCYVCKRFNAIAFRYPKYTDLPKNRVNLVHPFKHTGVDYTGHIFVKDDVTNASKKMYLLIFTCLNIRAIHIDLINNMTIEDFILSFIRFSNVFGIPSHIYSDNAKSFIAGCDFMKEVFTSDIFNNKFSTFQIKHIRIPLYSAWYGAVWERMIKTVKMCLYKTIGRSKKTYFQLLTVLSDIECAVNSRPLTYRSSDDSSFDVISPNSFLHPYLNRGQPLSCNIDDNPDPARLDLINTLESRDNLIEKFQQLWQEHYLLSLRETCKNFHETDFNNKVRVNDIVLIKNPAKPRPFWKLGKVIQLIPGADQKVRSVIIMNSKGTPETHAIKHLYPLELSLTDDYYPPDLSDDYYPLDPSHDHNLPDISNSYGPPDLSDDYYPVQTSSSEVSSSSSKGLAVPPEVICQSTTSADSNN